MQLLLKHQISAVGRTSASSTSSSLCAPTFLMLSLLLVLVSTLPSTSSAFHVGYNVNAGTGIATASRNVWNLNTSTRTARCSGNNFNFSFSQSPRRKNTKLQMTFMDDHNNNNNNDDDDRDEENEKDGKKNELELELEQTRQMLEQLMTVQCDRPTTPAGTTTSTATTNTENSQKALHDADLDTTASTTTTTTTTATATTTARTPSSSSSSSSSWNIISHLQSHAPPALQLTDELEQQRIQEIQLLSSLLHSDEAIAPLKALWMYERGHIAHQRLKRAMELVSVQSYREAEDLYASLVLEEFEKGFHWVEPVHGLATLYYMQGRYDDAKSLLEMVLDVKPWHVDALSSMILICTITNDVTKAEYWSSRRMPQLPPQPSSLRNNDSRTSSASPNTNNNGERFAWVKEAVEIARINLYNDSRVGRSIYVGQEGRIVRNFRKELELKLRKEQQQQQQQQQHFVESANENEIESQVHKDAVVMDAWQ